MPVDTKRKTTTRNDDEKRKVNKKKYPKNLEIKIKLYLYKKINTMAIPWAEIATGTAALVGTGAQINAQTKLNKRNREWQEKMYQRTLDDNISFWQMQNQYNRPEAQMQRFQEAGLNPHLIYGSGGAGAGNAGPINSPDLPNAEQGVADFSSLPKGAESVIATHFDTRIKKAQHNNLEKQNTVLDQDAKYRAAQTLKVLADTDTTNWDLNQKKLYEEFTAMTQKYMAESAKADYYQKEENLRFDQAVNSTRKKIIQQQMNQSMSETQIKAFHARMAEQNLTPSDGIYWRMAELLLSQLPDRFNPLKYKGSLKQY